MRVLLIVILLVLAAIGGCGGNKDKDFWSGEWTPTPQLGWSTTECSQAKNTLDDLMARCGYISGACEAVGQLQKDINDNCR